ncbi:MAG TPA: hypothetical protein C5S50_11230 [Methanosarcinaceae archaeon]|nr:hypothetical protein [Methanosarcinaceae archaeon]HJH32719.1 hypothetical protein [Methanosarcinaceae archaeon]
MGEVLHLAHNSPFLIIGEFHGNPGSLAIYDGNGLCLLSIHMTVSYPENSKFSKLKLVEPVIVGVGRSKLADTLVESLSFQRADDPSNPRCIIVNDNRMDFTNSDHLIFSLKVKSLKFDFSE